MRKSILIFMISVLVLMAGTGCQLGDQREVAGEWQLELSGNRVQRLSLRADNTYSWIETLSDLNGETVLSESHGTYDRDFYKDKGINSPCLTFVSDAGDVLFLEYYLNGEGLLLIEEEASLFIEVEQEVAGEQ